MEFTVKTHYNHRAFKAMFKAVRHTVRKEKNHKTSLKIVLMMENLSKRLLSFLKDINIYQIIVIVELL